MTIATTTLIAPPQRGATHREKFRALSWLAYDQLTDHQCRQIWEGSACGHPANRPKSEAEARSIRWGVDPEGWVRAAEHRGALAAEVPSARIRAGLPVEG